MVAQHSRTALYYYSLAEPSRPIGYTSTYNIIYIEDGRKIWGRFCPCQLSDRRPVGIDSLYIHTPFLLLLPSLYCVSC